MIKRDRSDRDSSPCPRRRRSRARTCPSRRLTHRPPRARGAPSSTRRRDRRGWRSIGRRPARFPRELRRAAWLVWYQTVTKARAMTSRPIRRGGNSPASAITFATFLVHDRRARIMPLYPARATAAGDIQGIHMHRRISAAPDTDRLGKGYGARYIASRSSIGNWPNKPSSAVFVSAITVILRTGSTNQECPYTPPHCQVPRD
jgi:hypothetical protein